MTVRGGRIVGLAPARAAAAGPGPLVEVPPGAVITGAFVDHHLHLLALMASRASIDVSAASSLDEVFDLLRAGLAAVAGPGVAGPDGAGRWVRAWGIDESVLAERRLPSRAELDAVAGARPLVVHHRTGHVRLLNRAAQRAGGVAPPLPFEQLRALAAAAGAELAAAGVVAVTDATHTNDLAALDLLDRLALPQRLTAMIGPVGLAELDARAGTMGTGTVGDVSIGPVKIMPPVCGLDAVGGQVHAARTAGRHVAVHAIDIDEVQAALDAGIAAGDRIEHLGLCLPEQLDELAARRVVVVTQPAFVTHRAAKYRRELSEPEQRWLYRLRSALDAGLDVCGSSDAPVVPARPLDLVAAAVGRSLGPAERIGLTEAFELISEPLAVGARADLVVLDADPRTVPTDRLAEIAVLATWRDGRLLHGEPSRWAPRHRAPGAS